MEQKGLSYKEYKQGRRFLVKILPGELLLARLADLIKAEKIESAVILSAIGSVKNVKLKDINLCAVLSGQRGDIQVYVGGQPWGVVNVK